MHIFVICCGMQRSGSTLQYNIVRELIKYENNGIAVGHINSERFIEKIEELKNPDKMNYSALKADRDKNFFTIIKAHQPNLNLMKKNEMNYKIIYSYRDLRDVYLSAKKKLGIGPHNLQQFLDGCIKQYKVATSEANAIVHPYEKLICHKKQCIIEIAEYLGIKVTHNVIEHIINITSLKATEKIIRSNKRMYWNHFLNRLIDKTPQKIKLLTEKIGLNKIVRTYLIPWQTIDAQTELHSDHISDSKGAIGRWRVELCSKEVEMIEDNFELILKEMGYT